MEIICGKYTFEPGNSVSLDGLTFSIGEGEILTITLEQFNAVAAN